VPLVLPTPIAFTTTTTNAALSCKGDRTASISVSLPTGGQGTNYLYTLNTTSATPMISSGPQADPVFTNLGAGTYTVTVTDGWGCGSTSTTSIDITEPTEVVASLVLATTQTCLTESTITLSATGGAGTYTYSADGTFNPSTNLLTYGTFVAATTIINVPVGSYRYYVRDANQCVSVVSNDVTIEPLPTLTVDLNIQNAKIYCRGDANGVIVATATGGLGNYVYTLLDGAGVPVPAATQLPAGNFTQLPAGSYRVRVDSGDCNVISTGIVTISEPLSSVSATAVPTAITCNGAKDGIITVTASGGTGAIKYAIEPRLDQFFDTGVFDELAPGTYQLIAQDESGCFVILSATITEPQPIFVNTVAGSEEQELCFGDNNAAFSINIAGGVAPYSVALDDINGSYLTGATTQNVFNFIGLTGGDHTVYIKDANGCTAEWLVALDPSVKLEPQALVAYGCDNNAPSNTVTVTLDASITNPADVDYALDGATVFQAINIFKNVAPGFHTITARHTNGCEKTTLQFEVLGFTALAVTLSDGGLNEIVATATGGAGNYRYSFDGGITFSRNNKLIYYKSDNYTVIVRDNNGCEQTASRYFEFIDIKIPNVFSPNGDGNNDTWTPTNTINYKDLTISVFDRYGRKVESLREGQGWDGKYNGLELPTGDYWYILKLKNAQDDREFVGHFTLMR
jgi:gliding motility-associated-like protein